MKKFLKNKLLYKVALILVGVILLPKILLAIIPYPELKAFKNGDYSTRFYDRNGNLFFVTPLEEGLRREYTPLKKIPKQVQKIVLQAEDSRFYWHTGVDLPAVIMAATQNRKSGRTVRGASTITMQLVKIMTPEKERTFWVKIGDVVNAFRIEAKLSKRKILELYLNSVPFGHSVEGITSAAMTFFGCDLDHLTKEQICCLSVIPRRPVFYDPTKNPEECAQKAFYIYKKITKAGAEDLQNLISTAKKSYIHKYPFYMPHYVSYLKSQLADKNGHLPYEVKTTADLELYFEAETQLHSSLRDVDRSRISNAALLLINNEDNSVLVWIGNYDWFDSEHSGQIDGVLVKNQPGSSMKPFLYALALEQKNEEGKHLYLPSSVLADIPKEFGSENLYIPANFNNRYNGPVRFRVSLASSLNVPAVAILDDLGVENYLKRLYDLGFDSLKINGREADLGLALGAGEVSLYELVNGFSVFPRDGKNKEGKQVYEKDTARLICSLLSDKNSRALGFGYSQTFETKYPSIFKTGTSNQYQDIVALGATPDYTIGVWMGNFHGQTVKSKTGSSLPAYVAKNMLDKIAGKGENPELVEFESFKEPENWQKQKICSLSGMIAGKNCPASVYEYFPSGKNLADYNEQEVFQECTWHRMINGEVQIVYPSEYQQWARQNKAAGIVDYKSSQLKITSPRNNTLFYYSELNSNLQAIPVEVIGGNEEELYVELDGSPYGTYGRPFNFKLPVERGNHRFTVYCGNEQESIDFQVK